MSYDELYAMTYFYKLPYEIIDYIRSINYIWAIEYISKMRYKRLVKAMRRAFNVGILRYEFQTNMGDWYISYKKKIFKTQDVFNVLTECKCCERHQVGKPKKFVELVEPEPKHCDKKFNTCVCSCRHICRHLCRKIDTQQKPEFHLLFYRHINRWGGVDS